MRTLITIILAAALIVAAQASWSLDWSVQTVDSSGRAGLGTSIAVDSSGQPRIGYEQWSNNELRYACQDGSTWNVEHIVGDRSAPLIQHVSFALDRADNPAISYEANGCMMYAYRGGGVWSVETVDAIGGSAGFYNSLKYDSQGRATISYFSYTDMQLRLAVRNENGWAVQVIGNLGQDEPDTCLAFDSNGNPGVTYNDNGLCYAQWNGSTWSIQRVDAGAPAYGTSLAFDKSGNPCISYASGQDAYGCMVRYAYWDGGSWVKQIVPDGYTLDNTSLALDASGNIHIAYTDEWRSQTWVAHYAGTSWTRDLVDTQGIGFASLAAGAGRLYLSYYGSPTGALMYASAELPEPSSLLALMGGLGCLGAFIKRRRK